MCVCVWCTYRIEKMAKLEVSGQNSPPIVTSAGISSLLNLDPARFFIYLGKKHHVFHHIVDIQSVCVYITWCALKWL